MRFALLISGAGNVARKRGNNDTHLDQSPRILVAILDATLWVTWWLAGSTYYRSSGVGVDMQPIKFKPQPMESVRELMRKLEEMEATKQPSNQPKYVKETK